MARQCSICGTSLDAFATRCRCGAETPEAQDALSDPERPRCRLCGTTLELMAETCPSCGARGFPALRARRGKQSLGPPPRAS
jgi:hypothetical protein